MPILVVNPPLASLASAPCAPLRVAAMLKGMEPLEIWDANLSFWQEHLLGGSALEAVDVLRGEGFYDPDAYVNARRAVDRRLGELSQEVAPGRYTWQGLEHPASLDPESSLTWAVSGSNPLTRISQRGLEARTSAEGNGLALLVLERPGQWLGALSLAWWFKRNRPAWVVALVGDCLELAGAPTSGGSCWDHALPLLDPQPLRELAASLLPGEPQGGCALRDVSLLPGPYLTPAPVFSLRPVSGMELEHHEWRDPGTARPRFMPVEQLAQGMALQTGRGVAAFLLLRQEMPAAYLARLAPALANQGAPLGLTASLDEPPDGPCLAALAAGGARLVHWRVGDLAVLNPEQRLQQVGDTLVAASRAGLWNHLELPLEASHPLAAGLLDFAGANPQLVHSWNRPELWPWSPRPRQMAGEPRASAYSQVEPLPGTPLWRFMDEPAHLLLHLARHGREALLRRRVRDVGGVYSLGQGLRYVFAEPKDIEPQRLEEIALLVLAAGKVRPKWLRYNLANAYVVGYAEEEGVIVGTDTLKRLRPEYLASINEQSGLDLTGYAERGYISIRPEYRGMQVASDLIQGIIARAGGRKMIIITGADNLPAHRVLSKNGQRLVRTYHSRRLDKKMQVWMPREQSPELGEEK